MRKYKIAFIGDAKIGKTRLIQTFLNGEQKRDYVPTLGVEVHELKIQLGSQTITTSCWDCAGSAKYEGLAEGYLIGADLVVIVTNTKNDNEKKWESRIQKISKCGMPRYMTVFNTIKSKIFFRNFN